MLDMPLLRIFQFPPPRGGEQPAQEAPNGQGYFNSRPREGANLYAVFSPLTAAYFNSRPREGANSIRYPGM